MNNILSHRLAHPAQVLLMLGAALAAAAVPAAPAMPDARARYEQERAVCLGGQSNQDRATCLREAGAAYAGARRDGAGEGPTQYQGNASKRCERLPDEDRRACVARMQGQGTTSGSVAGGGIARELVTREAGVPMSPAPDEAAKPVPTR